MSRGGDETGRTGGGRERVKAEGTEGRTGAGGETEKGGTED